MMLVVSLCSALASRQQDPELTCFLRRQGMTKSNTDKIMVLLLSRWTISCLCWRWQSFNPSS